jgi:hypothetical protein
VIVAGGRLYVNESATPAETTALTALAPPA